MAIVFESAKYKNVAIDSNTIIGVIGKDSLKFVNSLEFDSIAFLGRKYQISDSDYYLEYRKLLQIDDIINKKILSHSEKKLMDYYRLINSNAKIMVLNEPYVDLDTNERKNINILINRLVKDKKTIIITSSDNNIIYSLCKKVLIVNDDELYYDDINCLNNISLLNKYDLGIPYIVEFIELAKIKNKKIPYTKDIRDLIKDVYRNV